MGRLFVGDTLIVSVGIDCSEDDACRREYGSVDEETSQSVDHMIGCFLRVQSNAENHPRNNVDRKALSSRLVPSNGRWGVYTVVNSFILTTWSVLAI